MTPGFWKGRRVFLTGHTGFKGGWLALWLGQLGAKVHGYAKDPPTEPSLCDVAGVEAVLASAQRGDVRDAATLRAALASADPEVVFHLAAQPLVRHSYLDPVETYETNVLGTVNLLDAVRTAGPGVKVVVNVTTDKCYENREWHWGYREPEPLGGKDPYSSSKACSELVTAAYRDSFLAAAGVAVGSARAGNVIGGGDWAADRLLPDFFRATERGVPLEVRHPDSTRPWQHVLEPLSGYLLLAERLATQGPAVASAYNFGPPDPDARPVRWLLDYLVARAPGSSWKHVPVTGLHEARVLKLDSAKALADLGWRSRLGLAQALDLTLEWHRRWRAGEPARDVCLDQIESFSRLPAS